MTKKDLLKLAYGVYFKTGWGVWKRLPSPVKWAHRTAVECVTELLLYAVLPEKDAKEVSSAIHAIVAENYRVYPMLANQPVDKVWDAAMAHMETFGLSVKRAMVDSKKEANDTIN